jgi:hypothetical protein
MRALAAALALASALIATATTARADVPSTDARDALEIRDARADIGATMAQMRTRSLRVRDQLRATRKHGTKAQITCVDEALSRSDVALRRAREASDEALGAYGRRDLDAARASRRRLMEIHFAQTLAAKDGASCAPARVHVANVGATTVKLEIDPKIAPAPSPP